MEIFTSQAVEGTIDQSKPFVTFKINDERNLDIEAHNYPNTMGQCSGKIATKIFEQGLGTAGKTQYKEESDLAKDPEQLLRY